MVGVRAVGVAVWAVTLVGMAVLGVAPAQAAPSWTSPMTVAPVRGIPDPQVGMDRGGTAVIVYSDAPAKEGSGRAGIYQARRSPGAPIDVRRRLGDGVQPQVAVAPSGDTVVAWIDADRIRVLRQSAPGTSDRLVSTIDAGGRGADDLRLVLDAGGRATVVWKPLVANVGNGWEPVQLRAATVAGNGEVGPTEALGPPTLCGDLAVAGNLAGDVAALCSGADSIHLRAPGDATFHDEPFSADPIDRSGSHDPALSSSSGQLTVDGTGLVTVTNWISGHGAATVYRDHPRGGTFGPQRPLPGFANVIGQEGRTIALWSARGGVRFAVRPAGAAGFGAETFARVGSVEADLATAFRRVTAPLGPLPVLVAANTSDGAIGPLVGGIAIGADSSVTSTGRPTIPGRGVDFPGAVAASENGLAVAVWEQRCGEGFAVMAMVLDESRGSTEPPCQDRAAPKVLVRPRRARLVGRTLRFRAGCDERCRLIVRVRVLRAGLGKPLATWRTPRSRLLAGSRYSPLKLRLRAGDAARVRAALAAGRRVTVRFAMSVRDDFENGAVRRLAVPLRR